MIVMIFRGYSDVFRRLGIVIVCLSLLLSVDGEAASSHRLVIAQERNASVIIIAGKKYSLEDGMQAFSEKPSITSPCDVILMPDVPVLTLISVAEFLKDFSVSNVTWRVLDENKMDGSIISCKVKIIGRCTDQVSVIHLEEAPFPLLAADREKSVIQTNSAVLNSCKQIARGVEKVLPEEFILRGPRYIAKGESGMFCTERNGYYMLAIARSDPYMLFAGRSTMLVLAFLHPSYGSTAEERVRARGQTIVANEHVIIYVLGDYAKTWTTIGADLSRSFILSLGLEFSSGKSHKTGGDSIGDNPK